MSAPELMKIQREGVEERKKIIERVKDEPLEPFDCLGRQCRYVPHYTDRRRDIVLIDIEDVLFAAEHTHHPWSWLKPVTVFHTVDILVDSERRAAEILKGAGVDGEVEQDPYADPPRYYLRTGEDVEDVVKIYNYLKNDG